MSKWKVRTYYGGCGLWASDIYDDYGHFKTRLVRFGEKRAIKAAKIRVPKLKKRANQERYYEL